MDHCIALYAAEFKVGPNVFILKKYAYPFRELEPKPSDPRQAQTGGRAGSENRSSARSYFVRPRMDHCRTGTDVRLNHLSESIWKISGRTTSEGLQRRT